MVRLSRQVSGRVGSEFIITGFAVFDCDPGVIDSSESLSAIGAARVTGVRIQDFAETRIYGVPTPQQADRPDVSPSTVRSNLRAALDALPSGGER